MIFFFQKIIQEPNNLNLYRLPFFKNLFRILYVIQINFFDTEC